ncbi:MAG TPA: hypothetical protein VMW73_00640 [Spirochaetia bacterium]|nr:hypothetical protein [Spirochaetia bacterium]
MNAVFGAALRLLVICLASALVIGVVYFFLSPVIASEGKRKAQMHPAGSIVIHAAREMSAPSSELFGGII